MKRLTFAAAALAILTACGTTSTTARQQGQPAATPKPPTDSVLTEIANSDDCNQLQELFDVADEAHAFANENNALPAMKVMSARMQAANERMSEVGCYD